MAEPPSPFDAIRERFLLRLEEQRQMLDELSRRENRDGQAQAISHRIAGMAGSLGFPELSAAASDVEMLLVRDGPEKLHGTPAFIRLMAQIHAALEKRCL